MSLPLIGTWAGEILACRSYSIHGDAYFEIVIARLDLSPDSGDQVMIRAAAHAFSVSPETGQKVDIQFLMGQVTAVKLKSGSDHDR